MSDEKSKKLRREEKAMLEIGHTEISRRLARLMTIAFLLMIAAVPVIQHGVEIRANMQRPPAPGALTGPDLPQAYDIFEALPEAAKAFRQTQDNLLRKVLNANATLLRHINDYEAELENNSLLTKKLLGPTQHVLIEYLGHGNEKVYPGRDGWLFFRDCVDYVTGPGFLGPRRLAKRRRSGNEYTSAPEPDPREAVLAFNRFLLDRGVVLIVVPVPVKPSFHPEFFSSRHKDGYSVIQNESYAQLIEEIETAGVRVFDPAPVLQEAVEFSGMPQYLETDTHWRPGAMEIVAKRLAAAVENTVSLSSRKRAYTRTPMRVSHLGDLAVMLNLPADQTLFKKQTVSIRQVLDKRSGGLWQPIRSAEILVLGDSFSNVYSLAGMSWGQSAGFVEQLSFFLQRPIDAIIRNDSGAFATREALRRRMARGDDVLAGKRVVIWQFATRELALGDWKHLEM